MSLLLVAVACDNDAPQSVSPTSVMSQNPPASDDGAVLLLRFDQDLFDESSYHRAVYFAGTAGFKPGCDDRALMFEGNEYAYVNGATELEPAHVSVEVWMSPKRPLTDGGGFHPLVVKYSGNLWNTVDGYDLWYQDSGMGLGGRVGFGIGTDGGRIRKHASLSTTVLPSRLYHFVGTFDGSYARLYVNGEQVAQTPHSEPLAYLGGGIRIGGGVYHSYYGGWQYYRGLIDQVAIFPRAMDAEEIMTRYLSCNQHYLLGTSGDAGRPDPDAFSE